MSSSASIQAMSFVNESGAGAMSEAMSTSSSGTTSQTHAEEFTAGETSSSARGSVHNGSTEAYAITGIRSEAPRQPTINLIPNTSSEQMPRTEIIYQPVGINSVGSITNSSPSQASGSSSSFVNSTGAGGASEASATSPRGQTSSSNASAGASTQSAPVTEATASAGAETEPNPTPEPPLNVMLASPSDNPMMVGTASSDLIIGGMDNNRLFGNAGGDRLFGEGGDDLINGNQGDDNVNGGDGNDTLRGGKGNDWLNGGDDDDYLIGDFGVDTLIGGNGGDTFGLRIETVNLDADPRLADVIVDFNSDEGDRIALIGEVSLADIVLETIDFNGDGQINNRINPSTGADATLIKLGPNPEDGILAVVFGTVDARGQTNINIADFII